MTRRATAFAEALLAVALVTWVAASQLPLLGLASAALLFLLPVLLAAVRGGVGPGLVAALGGAACYNFFLIEPRYTLQVHRLDNLVSVFVLGAVALVTSRLASRLTAREAEARARARLSEEAAALSALLAAPEPEGALQDGIAFIEARYGPLLLLDEERLSQPDGRLSALDLAAAAWALHNGDGTGHGTPVMAAADWSVLPLRPARQAGREVLALARPADGRTRPESELHHLRQLALLIGQCRDRAALEAERRAREGLEERDRLRRTLLASLAHDFRTPLTIISGRLAELANERPDARDALAAAQRIERMMTDLIEVARIEAGLLTPQLESLDLVDVVGSACDSVRYASDIALAQDIAPDLPFVRGDPILLHHILANLIDNGLRHARARVIVAAKADGAAVRLRVSDDGPGVPAHERTRIFDRFARGEGGDTRQGSGLGLAIVKGFADAMGMSVTIDDAPGGGACFTLVLPQAGRAGP